MAISVPTDGYCEATDVGALTGVSYGASTTPTATEVETSIKEHSDLFNAALTQAGWSNVPLSSSATRSLRILKVAVAKAVAADALMSGTGGTRASARAETWASQAGDIRRQIAKGELRLPDATEGGDTPMSEAEQTVKHSFNQNTSGEEIDPTFTRDMKF